jgi:2-oxoglutarate dehydrogenase E2 component (dihydrolipoamide succinyltransferase)
MLLALQGQATVLDSPPPTTTAVRATAAAVPPALDGRDDDAVWRSAPAIDQFLEAKPSEGAQPKLRTDQRARSGTLAPSDVQHGTFTISNHGVSGSLIAAPIVIPQPQSAILGVGKLERRPVARERSGKEVVEVRPMCYVTLTIDHRVLDGYQANAFLARWVEEIEGWG